MFPGRTNQRGCVHWWCCCCDLCVCWCLCASLLPGAWCHHVVVGPHSPSQSHADSWVWRSQLLVFVMGTVYFSVLSALLWYLMFVRHCMPTTRRNVPMPHNGCAQQPSARMCCCCAGACFTGCGTGLGDMLLLGPQPRGNIHRVVVLGRPSSSLWTTGRGSVQRYVGSCSVRLAPCFVLLLTPPCPA